MLDPDAHVCGIVGTHAPMDVLRFPNIKAEPEQLQHLTLRRVLAKITDCVMASVSYKSHRVSSFHSSLSTFT